MPTNTRHGYAYKSSRTPFGRPQRAQRTNKPKHGQYIDPAKFVKVATPVTAEEYNPTHQFADFAVDERIQRNLITKGFVTPTPIQDKTIPLGLEGKDIIGIANTGTGKTVAFALPILHKLMNDPRAKALIVAPTRELAMQIEEEFRTIGKGGGFTGAILIGGSPYGPQLRDLRNKPRIIIGTPGRIKDHLNEGTLKLSDCNIVVLDEVDRMLDMGFVNDVKQLLSELATPRQAFYFSATMDARVSALIDTFSPEAVAVSVKQGDTSANVHQDVIPYSGNGSKIDALHNLLIEPVVSKAIVFEATQRNVERLEKDLLQRGFKVSAIHGGKTQGQRKRALDSFKQNHSSILIATDVAARGIDVPDVSHVINYGMPQTYDDYTHRIGRAGRAGKIGYALTFVEHR